jgi:hypothetical protein
MRGHWCCYNHAWTACFLSSPPYLAMYLPKPSLPSSARCEHECTPHRMQDSGRCSGATASCAWLLLWYGRLAHLSVPSSERHQSTCLVQMQAFIYVLALTRRLRLRGCKSRLLTPTPPRLHICYPRIALGFSYLHFIFCITWNRQHTMTGGAIQSDSSCNSLYHPVRDWLITTAFCTLVLPRACSTHQIRPPSGQMPRVKALRDVAH